MFAITMPSVVVIALLSVAGLIPASIGLFSMLLHISILISGLAPELSLSKRDELTFTLNQIRF